MDNKQLQRLLNGPLPWDSIEDLEHDLDQARDELAAFELTLEVMGGGTARDFMESQADNWRLVIKVLELQIDRRRRE